MASHSTESGLLSGGGHRLRVAGGIAGRAAELVRCAREVNASSVT